MPDPLRDRIAAEFGWTGDGKTYHRKHHGEAALIDGIVAAVRSFATSDAAVEAAAAAVTGRGIWIDTGDARAAILAALGGGDGG